MIETVRGDLVWLMTHPLTEWIRLHQLIRLLLFSIRIELNLRLREKDPLFPPLLLLLNGRQVQNEKDSKERACELLYCVRPSFVSNFFQKIKI